MFKSWQRLICEVGRTIVINTTVLITVISVKFTSQRQVVTTQQKKMNVKVSAANCSDKSVSYGVEHGKLL